jgi:hypothetical protein
VVFWSKAEGGVESGSAGAGVDFEKNLEFVRLILDGCGSRTYDTLPDIELNLQWVSDVGCERWPRVSSSPEVRDNDGYDLAGIADGGLKQLRTLVRVCFNPSEVGAAR